MASKEQLHEAVDRLPESQVGAALSFLQFLSATPSWPSMASTAFDDEPESEDERRAVREALSDPSPDLTHHQVLRDLGIR